MAVPKRRISTARKGKRRTAIKLSLPSLVACPSCGQPKKNHLVCPHCGTYGKEKLEVKHPKRAKQSKKIV